MNDLASLNAKPVTVKSGGKEYQVHPLTIDDHGDVQRWIDDQQETRIFEALERQTAKGSLPVEIQKYMARSALDILARNRILIGTPEADELLHSVDGKVYLTYLSIKKGDPAFTEADAKALVKREQAEAMARITEAADVIGADDPKSKPAGGSRTRAGRSQSRSTGGDSTTP